MARLSLVGGSLLATLLGLTHAWTPVTHAGMARGRVLLKMSDGKNPGRYQNPDGLPLSGEKRSRDELIYDSRTGRFFEKEIQEICNDEFCAIDEVSGKPVVLTVEEKEQVFVESMQAYYFDGTEILSDTDFDQLKEDLTWAGSEVANLNRDETKFLAAMSAYSKGNPILSDSEFDGLKTSLKEAGSTIAVSKEPKCFIDTGVCSVTWTNDKVRQLVSYTPTAIVSLVLWEAISFELTPLRYVNPLLGLILGTPFIYLGAKLAAENVFYKNPLIVSGPCPDCNTENRVFFGDVLGVKGFSDEADVKCVNCKAKLTIKRSNLRCSAPSKFDFEDKKAVPPAPKLKAAAPAEAAAE